MRGPRHLRAEKQAPERVVSRWFLSAGNIDDVSRLNRGFGFIRSWMKAKKDIFETLCQRNCRNYLHMLTQGRQDMS